MKLTRFHGHLEYDIVAITRGGSMKRSRKPYPAEFKQEAVRLLTEQRLPRRSDGEFLRDTQGRVATQRL